MYKDAIKILEKYKNEIKAKDKTPVDIKKGVYKENHSSEHHKVKKTRNVTLKRCGALPRLIEATHR